MMLKREPLPTAYAIALAQLCQPEGTVMPPPWHNNAMPVAQMKDYRFLMRCPGIFTRKYQDLSFSCNCFSNQITIK